MRRIKNFTLTFWIFTALVTASYGQVPCDSTVFDSFMNEGNRFLNRNVPNYHKAMYAYTAAMISCTDRMSEAQDKILIMFERINELRNQAESAKLEAQAERDIASQARMQAEQEKLKADTARWIAEKEQQRANEALALAKKIIDQFYFYNDKYALAVKKDTISGRNIYGFIDKQGNITIDFLFNQASQFDENTGFAKVKMEDELYLLNPSGKTYLLCEEVDWLNYKTEAIDLRYKALREFPHQLFYNKQLKIILLTNNFLRKIPSEITTFSESLLYLDLSKNKIRKISWEIASLINLKILNLSYNSLDSIPPEIGLLKNLIYLNLNENQLLTLPKEIGKLIYLEKLVLSNNDISIIQKEIFNLTNLKELNFNNNSIPSLPEDIGHLIKLKKLSISNNNLTEITPDIRYLKNLTELHLDSNQIITLPAEIEDLMNLNKLSLNKNKLTSLPYEMVNMVNLHLLFLQENNFAEEEKQRITRMLPNCKIYF